jgi:F-type H+-transporting ATPase subunit b
LKHSTATLRFVARIFWLTLLTALSLGVAGAPVHLGAQESAPAAQQSESRSGTAAQPAASPARAEPSEREGNDVYRHSPTVHSLSRLFHLDVETTARLFELLNFAILALAIGLPLLKFMPRVFRKRSETLRHDLESARSLTADATTRLSAVEARLARLDEEIAGIRAQVEEESRNDETRIKSTIEEERERIVAAAEQEIAAAAAHAKRGLRHFAADLAIEQAARQLVLTPETDRALIAEFVSDSAGGGKN